MTNSVRSQLAQRLQRVQLEAAATRLVADEATVHRLRVAVRRLTEALRALEIGRRLRRRLRPVMRAAGETRNLDVAIALCGESGVAGTGDVAAALGRKRNRAAQRLVRRLIELEEHALVLPDGVSDRSGAGEAALLRGLSAAYWEAGAQAAADGGAPELHAFRLHTKHLRYTLELFRPRAAARLALLRCVQGHLGDLNDCETARGMRAVRQCPELADWLAERQHKAHRRFAEIWDEAWSRTRGGRTWDRFFAQRFAAGVVPVG